jgi:hypothetical protein
VIAGEPAGAIRDDAGVPADPTRSRWAPATEIYVMHGETAAVASYSRRLVKEKESGGSVTVTVAPLPTVKPATARVEHPSQDVALEQAPAIGMVHAAAER